MLLCFTDTDGGWEGGWGGSAWAGICPVKMTHESRGQEELWGQRRYDTHC